LRNPRTPASLAAAEPQPMFDIDLDGSPVPARPGQSVAAALLAAGIRSWRTGGRGEGPGRPRGLFCGIGICFDCLVTVNGQPDQRACLISAAPGDRVRTQGRTGLQHPHHRRPVGQGDDDV
jgi:hypothetical protein